METHEKRLMGHSTTTWTEFCHFLTPLCVDSLYTLKNGVHYSLNLISSNLFEVLFMIFIEIHRAFLHFLNSKKNLLYQVNLM